MTKELAKNILAEHIKLMEQENEPSLKEDIDALTLAIQALSQEPTSEKELNKAYTFGHNKGVKAYYNEQLCTVELPEAVFRYILSLVPTGETEQEPCTDAVSRQAVKEQINCWVGSGEYRYAMSERFLIDRINDLPSVTQKSGKWDRLYSWLNDMRLGIAPDETVDDIDERNCRESQTDILDEIMEWMIKAESEDKE